MGEYIDTPISLAEMYGLRECICLYDFIARTVRILYSHILLCAKQVVLLGTFSVV